jgi:uncharacterized protein YndB with AHSA1/START domain
VSERTVKHDTIVVEREFKSSPARVFAAWADPGAHGLWKFPGDDWEISEFENDFRVGGREKSCFGPKGDPKYFSDGSYLDIVQEAGSSPRAPCTRVRRVSRPRCARWNSLPRVLERG